MKKRLLKNPVILAMDEKETLYENGYMLINGDSIEALGPWEAIEGRELQDYEIIDCKGKIIMPGMVNTHGHMPMTVFRSLGDDINNRLHRYIFPLEKHTVNASMVYGGSLWAAAEMIMGGVTTAYSTYYYSNEVAEAIAESGMKGFISETIINFPCPGVKEAYGGFEVSRQFMDKWDSHERVYTGVYVHAPYSCDAEHMIKAKELAKEYNRPLSMHLAEMPFEYTECIEKYGMSPVAYVNSLGILDEYFLAAHVIDADEKDIKILTDKNVKVSHCPKANTKAGKGISPVYQMRKAGITVGMGTDGAMSGNTLDILDTLSFTALMQRAENRDASIFTAKELLYMATIEGAKCLGLEKEIGSLEKGKKADIIMFETDSIHMSPIFDYYSAIVFSANASNIVMTMVNGNILMQDRRLLSMDKSRIKKIFMEEVNRVKTFTQQLDKEYKEKNL